MRTLLHKLCLLMVLTAVPIGILGVGLLESRDHESIGSDEALAAKEDRPRYGYDHLIVIGRREERMWEKQTDVPFRNSRMAVYELREPATWHRISEVLPVRSKSTAEFPDGWADSEQERTIDPDKGYGFLSVPLGLYSLRYEKWRDGINTSFLISEWDAVHGKVFLDEMQVLYSGLGMESRRSRTKKYCYMHPTPTTTWAHHDSLGCINLHQPKDPESAEAADSDWNHFISILTELRVLRGRNIEAGLVILDEETAFDEQGRLREIMNLEFYRDGFKVRARTAQ